MRHRLTREIRRDIPCWYTSLRRSDRRPLSRPFGVGGDPPVSGPSERGDEAMTSWLAAVAKPSPRRSSREPASGSGGAALHSSAALRKPGTGCSHNLTIIVLNRCEDAKTAVCFQRMSNTDTPKTPRSQRFHVIAAPAFAPANHRTACPSRTAVSTDRCLGPSEEDSQDGARSVETPSRNGTADGRR